tara:strand:+ start:48561 stop:48887 length:327 start_codon:yes stop_codon:yes gene_type:complete
MASLLSGSLVFGFGLFVGMPLWLVILTASGTSLLTYISAMITAKNIVNQAAAFVCAMDEERRCDLKCPCDKGVMLEGIPFNQDVRVIKCDDCQSDLICRFEATLVTKG